MGKIPEAFLTRIQEAKEKQSATLDLSARIRSRKEDTPIRWVKLSSVPSEVFELTHLKTLRLSHNSIVSIPKSILKLQNLRELDLTANSIATIPDSISQLPKLTSLSLSGNKFTSLPDSISQLRNLTYLNLHSCHLTAFPEVILKLKKLKSLNLGGLKLGSVPDSLAVLKNLEELYLWDNELTSIPEVVFDLVNLTALYLNRNKLTSIPEQITRLKKLKTLHLWNNRFTSIPDPIYRITSLEELTLESKRAEHIKGESSNSIEEVPPQILELKNLKSLTLKGNPIKNIPPEIVSQGIGAIRKYFRQLEEEGEDYLHEAKLLILGEGGAGKTTLANKIMNPSYELCEEISTQGIEVSSFSFPIENGNTFRANIWDFGGQEIYHATHQFFLTKRSLYVLVADTRKEDTDFYYWLNVVELLSDNSPLLIIKNEKQNRHREINERHLRGQFSNLKETLATNLAINRGLAEVVDYIKHYITKLPHVGTPLPKTWIKVRASLEQDTRDYITLTEYQVICEQNGFTDLKDKFQLSGYLHDLGVILHFQGDPILKNTIILNPKWGTSAAYKVLDNRTVIGNYGKFSKADLANIWDEPEYAYMHDELLRLMINFKLCYQFPDTDLYIAPQLLSENQPAYTWDEKNNLILRYTYEFMPKGIITQFIVAVHHLISEQMNVWKSGVILEREQTQAEIIEYYSKREIRIRVSGKHMKELITIVTYELDRINGSYKRLKVNKLIPCNCALCRDNQEPHFYHSEILRKFINDGQDKIQCQLSYHMVDVRALLDDVVQLSKETEEGYSLMPSTTRDRVFISYSHLNKDWLSKFQTALRPLIRNGNINVWDDTQIRAGSKWKDEIEDALKAAKVALLLVTHEFLASDFIAENELPPLLEAAEKEGLTVLWVAVTHSMYKNTPIAEYQAANNPSKPLDELTSTQLNRALVDICDKIKSAMSK